MTIKPPGSPLHAILVAYQRPPVACVAAAGPDEPAKAHPPACEPLRRNSSAGTFRDPLQDPRYRVQVKPRPAIASSELLGAMISQMGGAAESSAKGRHVDVFV
jgi:hypothetical protein